MSRKLELLKYDADVEEYCFLCPGCECSHWVRVRGKEPVWTWNRSEESPTLKPSLLIRFGYPEQPQVCHFFVTDGQMQFLPDSTHKLAGQTVPMPDWE